MKPATFPQANKVVSPDKANSIKLHLYKDSCTTCWRMSLMERISALLWGRVWVTVKPGHWVQPPMAVVARRTLWRKT